MAGDCTHTNVHYVHTDSFCPSRPWSDGDPDTTREMESVGNSIGRGHSAQLSPNFEVIDGILYRKKLERGFINYREVLDEDRRHEAISTFHQRRPGQRHLSLEDTYKCVADNYWWEGMYFQIRDFALGCPECQSTKKTEEMDGKGCLTKTMASHSAHMLNKLRSQREAGLFCDITLRTNGRSYSAHRAVLAAVSDHFQEIFTNMDSSVKEDIDLTGFSEDSLLSLLDFSYSSTLCVRQEKLPEVITMARHLGMWPAVEACSALMKEQEQQSLLCATLNPGKRFTSPFGTPCRQSPQKQTENKRKRALGLGDSPDESFCLSLDASDESLESSPKRNLRKRPHRQGQNGLPLSPSHRMKLMDFKSPSFKRTSTGQKAISSLQSQNYSPVSPSHTRLLRSTPGAAKEVQILLPMPKNPRQHQKSQAHNQLTSTSSLRTSAVSSPVKIKQEREGVGEDEEDYERAQEKYKLMSVLGLQRTALLPRPEDLVGWRQKKRLRKLKANNYSLTKRRKPRSTSPVLPYGGVTLELPLCNPVNTHLLSRSVKNKSTGQVSPLKITPKKPKNTQQHVPPSDRSMRSKVVLPDLFQPASRPSYGGRELRRSVRQGDGTPRHPQQPPRRSPAKTTVRSAVRIKSEPAEYTISGLSSPSKLRHSQTPPRSLPLQKTQPRSKVTLESVKTLRYNSSRPTTKAKLRRDSTKNAVKTKGKLREEGKKARNHMLRGVIDTRQGMKDKEPGVRQRSEHAPTPSICNHPLYKVIKEEPAEPVPIGGSFCDPPSPDLGKRQSKPPIKLLDSGFLFSFCRQPGGAIAGLKKEEESVDICLTRSVSQVGERFGAVESHHRALRARGTQSLPVIQKDRERDERSVKVQRPGLNSQNNTLRLSKSTGSKVTRTVPLKGKLPLRNKSCIILDAVHRARLKQLRGPRSQAPKVPKATHACLQCPASYRDCDALMMHQLRHIEGKHWPCPLCSKTFFRLSNVRNHIRTHDPKLYKCRSCIVAGS